jgi:integrase
VFEVLHWTGARISDAVKIGAGHVGRDGVLAFTQTKTRDMAFVPWTCALPDYASDMEEDRQFLHQSLAPFAGHMTFLATHGRSRSHKAAGHLIATAAQKLGIGKSAHGLRKYRATTLAESGATASQIAAWTGHRSLSEVAHYTRSADRRRAVMGTEQDRNFVNRHDPDCKLSEK